MPDTPVIADADTWGTTLDEVITALGSISGFQSWCQEADAAHAERHVYVGSTDDIPKDLKHPFVVLGLDEYSQVGASGDFTARTRILMEWRDTVREEHEASYKDALYAFGNNFCPVFHSFISTFGKNLVNGHRMVTPPQRSIKTQEGISYFRVGYELMF